MADTLEFDEMPIADDASLALNDMEKKQIIHALEQAKGNRKLAAQYCSASILSNVSTVYQRLAKQTAKNPVRWTAVCPIVLCAHTSTQV